MSFDTGKYLIKYLEETIDRLSRAETALLDFEKDPDPQSLFRGVKREVHTLKGSSKMLGFEEMNQLTHSMEDFFDAVSEGTMTLTEARLDIILALFDVIRSGAQWIVDHGSETEFNFADGRRLVETLMMEDRPVPNQGEDFLHSFERPESTFLLSKKDLFAQLGLQAPPEPVPGDPAEPEREEASDLLVPPLESEVLVPERHAAPEKPVLIVRSKPEEDVPKISLKPSAGELDGSNVDQIVDGKINERVFQNQVKVDSHVIDNLTHHSMETSFHVMHFENILKRYKKLDSRLKREVDNLVGIDRNDMEPLQFVSHAYAELFQDFQKTFDQFNNILSKLTDSILATKLIPLSNIFNTFPRYVRDLSRELGKKIDLVIEGGETKLDKNILTCLNEALIHIIRNAIDHGIEVPEERVKYEKPEKALLEIKAYNQGNKVVIVVRDDGRGINLEKVKQKALEKKLVLPEKVEQISKKDLLEFIFLSGFSTSDLTTDISGRGVGMDVVRKNINRYHGHIDVDTQEGTYSEFRMILPMAMSTSHLLFVGIEGRSFGLPIELLSGVHPLENSQIMLHKRKLSLIEKEKIVEVVDIGQYLGLRDELNPLGSSYLLKTTLRDNVLLLVDKVHGQKDQVVKKFDDFLGKPMFSSGATQIEDGSTLIVLDVFDLINYRGRESQLSPSPKLSEKKKNRILLIDDSAMTREIEASILESAGYEVVTAVDGLDAFEKLSLDPNFDLIVTDIEMPRMDGFELAAKIRKTQQLASLPIVMVTSLSKSTDRLRGLEVGANAYLTKQALAKGALIQTVRQFIGGD